MVLHDELGPGRQVSLGFIIIFFVFVFFLFLFCRPCATKTWAKTCSNTCRDSRN